MKIGITERGDASVHFNEWVKKLDAVDGAILITKDPMYLYNNLHKFDVSKCIFHCTITGWGGTKLEPGVPEVYNSILGYLMLVREFGGEQVVLRIDPIDTTPEGLERAEAVFSAAQGRVRISFMDMYSHIKSRIKRKFPEFLEQREAIYGDVFHLPLEERKTVLRTVFPRAEICGEPGLPCTGCVSAKDLEVLELQLPEVGTSFQRKSCSCLAVKTELLNHRHPCRHGCLYCYWKD